MELNSLERMALTGLLARQREAERAVQEDYQALVYELEKRLKLKKGAIGATHFLDTASLSVVEHHSE